MSRSLQPRHEQAAIQAALIAKIERIINGTPDRAPQTSAKQVGYRSGEGDRQRMRAIPIIAPNVGGTIPGTDPLNAYLDHERRTIRNAA